MNTRIVVTVVGHSQAHALRILSEATRDLTDETMLGSYTIVAPYSPVVAGSILIDETDDLHPQPDPGVDLSIPMSDCIELDADEVVAFFDEAERLASDDR